MPLLRYDRFWQTYPAPQLFLNGSPAQLISLHRGPKWPGYKKHRQSAALLIALNAQPSAARPHGVDPIMLQKMPVALKVHFARVWINHPDKTAHCPIDLPQHCRGHAATWTQPLPLPPPVWHAALRVRQNSLGHKTSPAPADLFAGPASPALGQSWLGSSAHSPAQNHQADKPPVKHNLLIHN